MSDLKRELDALRARLAQIDRKYEDYRPSSPLPFPANLQAPGFSAGDAEDAGDGPNPGARAQAAIEDWLGGQLVETSFGRHFETETFYPSARHHGSADIGALAELPPDLLGPISGGAVPSSPPSDWAFLDTETTGMSANMGACAFLVGIGRITAEGFEVRQFFMRHHEEEASLLDAVARYLAPFRVLVTYNGRAFDQPLLETRYMVNGAPQPFDGLEHLDLLSGARRLWKLRYQSCRLVDLEREVLGYEREGDVPSALIPYLYFEYLRTHQAARLLPVFHHNALDIVTLACLTAIVPHAFRYLTEGPERDPKSCPMPLKHGAEMAGMARWLRSAGELEQARGLFRQAVAEGLREDLLFDTLWDIAALERKLGEDAAAVALWEELTASPNRFRVKALIELAKHHEHRAKDPVRALQLTQSAFDHPVSGREVEDLLRRQQRLENAVARRAGSRRNVRIP